MTERISSVVGALTEALRNIWPLSASRRAAEHAAVLPLLCSQLTETAKQVEESVVTVCGTFHHIAERAQHSVAAMSSVTDDNSPTAAADAQHVGETANATLRQLLDRVEHSSQLSMRAVAGMDRVQTSMRDIGRILGDIDRLAMTTHLLALNASIEAARSGEHGKAFGVVADEMAHMAIDSGRTSVSIREIVTTLTRDVASLTREMRTLAEANLAEANASRSDIEGVMTTLTSSNERLRQSVADAVVTSRALASDIASAVVTLQFQDAVSQRVHHVVEALTTMHRDLAAGAREPQFTAGAETLATSYTMHAEREAHAKHFGDSTAAPASAGGTVELF